MILEILLVVLALLILFGLSTFGWGIGRYNMFKSAIQDIKTQWSNIKTEYQRRVDLFYNLVESVKSYKNFEKETLIQVIQARNVSRGIGANQLSEMKKLKGLDSALSKLMVVFERYPKLKADKQYIKLMEEVRITEDRINVARTDYNSIVNDYNTLATTFPANIIANMFRFKVEEYFVNEPETDKAPKMKF